MAQLLGLVLLLPISFVILINANNVGAEPAPEWKFDSSEQDKLAEMTIVFLEYDSISFRCIRGQRQLEFSREGDSGLGGELSITFNSTTFALLPTREETEPGSIDTQAAVEWEKSFVSHLQATSRFTLQNGTEHFVVDLDRAKTDAFIAACSNYLGQPE